MNSPLPLSIQKVFRSHGNVVKPYISMVWAKEKTEYWLEADPDRVTFGHRTAGSDSPYWFEHWFNHEKKIKQALGVAVHKKKVTVRLLKRTRLSIIL